MFLEVKNESNLLQYNLVRFFNVEIVSIVNDDF